MSHFISSNAIQMLFQQGQRILLDGQFATIRYVGPISQWGHDITALGIEWDNPSRGKNNGNVGDHQYFMPQKPGSGSFIKTNNSKLAPPKTFVQSLMDRYGLPHEQSNQHIKFGSKVVENYGFEKLNQINANFSNLISVSLDKQVIYKCDKDEIGNLVLPKVTKLDLSYNLFTRFDDIETIIERVPQLKELNLNGNKFDHGIAVNKTYPNITSLKISDTGITMEDINMILRHLPNLTELTIASNGLNDDDLKALQVGGGDGDGDNVLEYLDLSYNELEEIPDITSKNVNLSNNRINRFTRFRINILDLRFNDINDWDTINKLSIVSGIEEIRINDNPLFSGLTEDELMIHIIGRFNSSHIHNSPNQLSKLNGSYFTEDEILNSELYFISKVKQGVFRDINDQRFKEMLMKHEMGHVREIESTCETYHPSMSSSSPSSTKYHEFSLEKIHLNIYKTNKSSPQTLLARHKLVLKTYTILKLLGIISKLIDKPVMTFDVYYYINEDLRLKQYLDNEISTIHDIQLINDQDIYVEI